MANRVVSLLALGIFVSTAGLAQFELGSVVGAVTDSSGLPMATVTVEIRSSATNVARQTTTSATGEYDIANLQPGRYALTAKRQGFKTWIMHTIALPSAGPAR